MKEKGRVAEENDHDDVTRKRLQVKLTRQNGPEKLWLPVHCVKHGHLLVHVDTKLFREVGVLGRIQYRSGSIHHSVKSN